MIDLSLIWIVIIAIGVFIYVVLDGFDLGIGILFPFIKNQQERDVMMNTVAPVWEGNETWMVLGGAGLFAAFPIVYSAVLSALYLPIILMVIALIFRGVAFEFRFKANRSKPLWDAAFIGGSVLSSFLQGVILGAYIQGIHIVDGRYAGGGLDWLTPFSLFTGVGVVVVYAALGCGWLIMKTDDVLQSTMYRLMPRLIIVLLLIFIAVSIYTPMAHPIIAERWFNQPSTFIFQSSSNSSSGFHLFNDSSLSKTSGVYAFFIYLGISVLSLYRFSDQYFPLCYSTFYYDLGCSCSSQ